jgi:hypothetical protein
MTTKRDALDDALNELWHYYSLTGAAYELIEKVRADHGNSPANDKDLARRALDSE